MVSSKSSPLLKGEGLPEYKKITSLEVSKNIPQLIEDLKEKLALFENELDQKLVAKEILDWEDVMPQLYEIGEKLRWSWGVVSHLNAVCNTEEFRKVYSTQQPKIVRFSNQLAQNTFIYNSLSNLKEKKTIKF